MLKRAYSQLEIKAVDEEKRELVGIATTPSTDSYGDVVEPKGAEFKLPVPFLWQHDGSQPIGHVTKAKVTKDGIEVVVKLVRTDEPGTLKDRLDEAWQSIKLGLVRGLSIGFRSIEHAYIEESRGIHFLKWMWLELSAVTIPANADASVTAIRSIDTRLRAASGNASRVVHLAGVSAPAKGREAAMNIQDQIKSFEATRSAKDARMSALMEKAGDEGRTLEADEQDEYDGLAEEVKSLDAHLVRLADMEKRNVERAKAVKPQVGQSAEQSHQLRGNGASVIHVERKLDKGIAFARFVGCMAKGRGNSYEALQFAKSRFSDDARLHQVIDLYSRMSPQEIAMRAPMVTRAAVDVGTTVDSDFAAPLVYATQMATDFIEYLRPMTILGRLQGVRNVPFNIRMARQTAGATAQWVGEGAPKPVGKQSLDTVTLAYMKLAIITVITEELARFSSPDAETIIRNDLAAAVIEQMDNDFVDPENAGSANVKPASITNGVTPIATAGTSEANARTDLVGLLNSFIEVNMGVAGLALIMPQSVALALSIMVNSLGQPSFPGISASGGTLLGIPVITSESAGLTDSSAQGKMVIAVKASDILVADEGQVTIDVSREASVQMDSAPDDPADATTVYKSLWQSNLIGIKAERFVTWTKARSTSAAWIQSVNWGGS